MKLTVEYGRGLPEANSYLSNADAINNLPSSSMDEWNAYTDDERIDRLVAASQFIDISFTWIGKQKTFEQGMSWPRINVMFEGHAVPDDLVPRQVKRAAIMALLLIQSQGLEIFQSTGEALIKKEKFAVMETEYFAPGYYAEFKSKYEDMNNLLRGFYTAPTGGNLVIAEVLRA